MQKLKITRKLNTAICGFIAMINEKKHGDKGICRKTFENPDFFGKNHFISHTYTVKPRF